MADNFDVTPGTGKTVGTDDVGGVHYQKIKLDAGGDGVSVPVIAGQQTSANSIPVVLSTEQEAALTPQTDALTDTELRATPVPVSATDLDIRPLVNTDVVTAELSATDNAVLDAIAAVEGTTSGAAVVTDSNGTIQQYLRGLVKLLITGGTIVLGAGTAAIGKLAANAGVTIGAVEIASAQTLGTVTTVSTLTGGGVAHDGADSGNPLKVGGRARSSEIAAVANDDRTDFVADLTGKQIIMPYANPENFVSGAITSSMTGTTSTSLVAAPGAGLRNYITTIIVSNAHASVGTDVIIQDGSGGTTLLTIPAASVYGGAVINLPVPLRQPTANTAIYCQNVTTGASTKVSAVGYKGA